MTDRLIIELSDGKVSVTPLLSNELPSSPRHSDDFDLPLPEDALDVLRWYLEDRLRPPFGVMPTELEPMVSSASRELEHAGVSERPRTVLADAGYWHKNQMEHLLADGFRVLVPPDSMVRDGARPGWEGGMHSFMRRVLSTDLGRELYEKRRRSIEPLFGQIKHNRGMTRIRRRGRAAVRSEWRLIAATHNLLRLHSHWIAPAAG